MAEPIQRPYTFFMMLKTTPHWLTLTRPERLEFMNASLQPIFEKYKEVKLRYYDAEAFTARITDIAVWETSNLQQYYFLIDALRDTKFWGHFFEVMEIFPAIENGYVEYNEAQGIVATQ